MWWMLYEDFCGSLIDSLEDWVEKTCNKFVKKANSVVDELILGKVEEKNDDIVVDSSEVKVSDETKPMPPAVIVK